MNKNNKYQLLLKILEEEKRIISTDSNSIKSKNRLAEIQEIKSGYSVYELDCVIELAKKNPDLELIKKKYLEYYKSRIDKKKKRIRAHIERLNEEYELEQKERKLKEQEEEDELVYFILFCIMPKNIENLGFKTQDIFIQSLMTMMIEQDNQHKHIFKM